MPLILLGILVSAGLIGLYFYYANDKDKKAFPNHSALDGKFPSKVSPADFRSNNKNRNQNLPRKTSKKQSDKVIYIDRHKEK